MSSALVLLAAFGFERLRRALEVLSFLSRVSLKGLRRKIVYTIGHWADQSYIRMITDRRAHQVPYAPSAGDRQRRDHHADRLARR
jgi:hypothetical protein